MKLLKSDLLQFTGTEQWYRHSIARNVLYTDGARHVAEAGGAYWLLDEIAFAQAKPKVMAEEFQLWRLRVKSDRSALLTCEDGNARSVFAKLIGYTDFPLENIVFYFIGNVILLPSEY